MIEATEIIMKIFVICSITGILVFYLDGYLIQFKIRNQELKRLNDIKIRIDRKRLQMFNDLKRQMGELSECAQDQSSSTTSITKPANSKTNS